MKGKVPLYSSCGKTRSSKARFPRASAWRAAYRCSSGSRSIHSHKCRNSSSGSSAVKCSARPPSSCDRCRCNGHSPGRLADWAAMSRLKSRTHHTSLRLPVYPVCLLCPSLPPRTFFLFHIIAQGLLYGNSCSILSIKKHWRNVQSFCQSFFYFYSFDSSRIFKSASLSVFPVDLLGMDLTRMKR